MTDQESRQVDELESLLLRAGREQAPPRGALRRAMVATGVAAPIVLLVGKASALLSTVVGKVMLGGAVVAAVVVGYLGAGGGPATPAPDSDQPADADPAPTEQAAAPQPAPADHAEPASPLAWGANRIEFSAERTRRLRVLFSHALPSASGVAEIRVF